MKRGYKISEPQNFQSIIDDILAWYKNSNQKTLIIALQGDLGAGKTTFTQVLGKSLKVGEPITSPTFTIMKQYDLTDESFDLLVHIDAYRIESESETTPLRLTELLQRPGTIICIEWPENISSVVPDTAVLVELQATEKEVRNVTMMLPSEK